MTSSYCHDCRTATRGSLVEHLSTVKHQRTRGALDRPVTTRYYRPRSTTILNSSEDWYERQWAVEEERGETSTRFTLVDERTAPCGRRFKAVERVAEHLAYWAERGEPCSATNTARGHGLRARDLEREASWAGLLVQAEENA